MPAKGDRPAGPCLDGQTGETSPSGARPGAALGLTGAEEVFEVDTGYGYQTALLARLAARVVSIDIWSDLAGQERRNLTAQDIGNVVVLTGGGTEGARELAPFDAIVISAAYLHMPAGHSRAPVVPSGEAPEDPAPPKPEPPEPARPEPTEPLPVPHPPPPAPRAVSFPDTPASAAARSAVPAA